MESAFDGPPDLGVFVTTRVDNGEPIDVIDHHHDGDWVFLTHSERRDAEGQLLDEDLMLVHLQHVAERHPEVQPFADLPRGWYAARQPDGTWTRDELIPDKSS